MYIFTNSAFIKFFIVGGIGFVLDFGVSYILIERVKTAVWLATLFSTESAIISNFFLNNYWSFAHKRIQNNWSKFMRSFVKFNLVSAGSIVIQTGGMTFLSHTFGQRLWYLYKFGIIMFVIIPYSYILYNKLIWKDK